MTLADRIMVIRSGQMEQFASPTDIYERPASRFVARFIGSPTMNMLEAHVAEDRISVQVADRIALKLRRPLSQTGRFTLGIRPEDLHIPGGHQQNNAFQARVDLVETLGSDTVIHCGIDDMEDALVARLPGGTRVSGGEKILLGLDATKLHFFNPQTGVRIRRMSTAA
jgi:ABC-type sugar transport system ATPase subunit